MTDVFREVDEALKQDRVVGFWKENGTFIIGCAVAIVLATAVSSAYRTWDSYSNKADTSVVLGALEAEDVPEQLEAVSGELRAGHRGVAMLLAAGSYIEEGRPQEALEAFAKIADDSRMPDDLREYGLLMKARLMQENEINETSPVSSENVISLLKPLTDDSEGAWHWHALIQTALAYAHLDRDYTRAAELAGRVAESDLAPATVRSRAMALQSVYAVKSKTSTGEQ